LVLAAGFFAGTAAFAGASLLVDGLGGILSSLSFHYIIGGRL